ncbi:hypothetical protein J6590_015585 [Homalodisca vitripennis]|nr:hypothetical protein J6590_015585 [Homalodisca vitripennis]
MPLASTLEAIYIQTDEPRQWFGQGRRLTRERGARVCVSCLLAKVHRMPLSQRANAHANRYSSDIQTAMKVEENGLGAAKGGGGGPQRQAPGDGRQLGLEQEQARNLILSHDRVVIHSGAELALVYDCLV